MRREWEPEELIACWTLVEADQELVANKSGATRLGFALLLKFFELEAQFLRDVGELPPAAVNYMAEQVRVDAAELDAYGWSGRTIEYHRAQIRQAYGLRETTRSDETDLAAWLAEEVCPVALSRDRLREVRCRQQRIEPPGRIDRIVGAAVTTFEHRFCAEILGQRPPYRVGWPGHCSPGSRRSRRDSLPSPGSSHQPVSTRGPSASGRSRRAR